MKWDFQEWLGLVSMLVLLYLLALQPLPAQVQGAFIALLTLIGNFFFRKKKPPKA